MSVFTLPQSLKIVNALSPVSTNAATTGDIIALKNVTGKVWVVCNMNQTVGHATTIGIDECTSSTGAGATATTKSIKWWKNTSTTSADTLVEQTAAATMACAATTQNQMIIGQIDPAQLSTGTDAIRVTITASSQSTNHASVIYYIQTQYKGQPPPTAITS